MLCSLCKSENIHDFFFDEKRNWNYWECGNCKLVFRDPSSYLDRETEKGRYETHNNSIENVGYVKFLSPNVEMILPFLNQNCKGLDFGSGPGPILDQLFAKKGIEVVNYDPYFDPHPELLERQYDFVTCTEAIEHFYNPGQELETITALIRPGGYLVLMTEFRKDKEHFSGWGYRMDNTHVVFFNEKSLSWICEKWNYELIRSEGRISLLQKKS